MIVKNHDGETIKLQTTERGVLNIRFSGTDTPETGQANWRAAAGFLRLLVDGKKTTVWCHKRGRYDREIYQYAWPSGSGRGPDRIGSVQRTKWR